MENANWFASWFDTDYYHILYKNRDEREAKVFIKNLVNFLHLPTNSFLLDLACGKGRHAVTLSQYGYKVLGVDLSPKNIHAASQYSHETLQFRIHDMREIIPNHSFDAVFNLFTSFGYFNTPEDNLTVLHSIHQMLKDKGFLLIDFMNVRKTIENMVVEETKTIEGISFHIRRTYDNKYIYKQIDFEDQGTEHRHTECVQFLELNDFQRFFDMTGFELVHYFGDFELQPFVPEHSDRLILLAQKK